jgi:integrase
LKAKWQEIDLERATWTVPPERMKAGREHRVPLSTRALTILSEVERIPTSDFVFPGHKTARPLSSTALEMVMRRMKVAYTPHGFRSSFRDWAAETTPFPNEVCEAALAHVVENKAEAAYRRGDLYEKRRMLMEAWASYCSTPRGENVLALRGAA